MPTYHLPNGKVVHSEKPIPPEQMDDFVSSMMGSTDAQVTTPSSDVTPPLSDQSNEPPQVGEPQDDSFLTRAWKAVNSPMVDIRSATPEVKTATDAFAKDHPYIGGALNFGADALSSLTSPLNIATTGAFAGSGMAGAAGLPSIAKGLKIAGGALSTPVAGEGAYNTFRPDASLPERAGGLAEMIGGVTGMRSGLGAIGEGIKSPTSEGMNPDEIKSAGSGITPEAQAASAIGSTLPNKPHTIYVKGDINTVKKARELGYKYVGKTSDGRFKMEYTGEPSSPILEGETADVRPTAANAKRQKLGPDIDPQQSSFLKEAYNTARAATTTLDLSAPARQGLPLWATKAWWGAWDDMIKSAGSEKAFQAVQQGIADNPLFKERVSASGKKIPSFASEAGLKLTDLTNLSSREEAIASNWLEKIPGYGRLVRGSNRAYTAFLNKLRADHFESLINDSKGMGIDPMKDLTAAREIADFVNNATGRGSLRASIPSTVSYFGHEFNVPSKLGGGKGIDLERHAELLSNIFFSPRNMASRMQMMNPVNYTMASPFIRKQYLKSMVSSVSAWMGIAGLAKAAGADVSLDPTNADFGKIRIGDARLDPAGGFQQYLVLFTRLAQGKYTSSTTGQEHEFGQGFKPETRASTAMNFGVNKLHPMLKFGYDMMNASNYRPFSVGDRVAKMFVPMLVSDINELAQEDPKLAVMLGPLAAIGMGTQYYNEKGQGHSLVPEDMDYQFTGGPFGQ